MTRSPRRPGLILAAAAVLGVVFADAADATPIPRDDLSAVVTRAANLLEAARSDDAQADALADALTALAVVAPDQADPLIEQVEAAGRGLPTRQNAGLAEAAVKGWAALGRLDRARALARIWIARAAPTVPPGHPSWPRSRVSAMADAAGLISGPGPR